MTLDEFDKTYAAFKSSDKIMIACDNPNHPAHIPRTREIGKQSARRNILKKGGKEYICRDCHMIFNNPMNQVGENRQTDEVIIVYCPDPRHVGPPGREMKKKCYMGEMKEPYSSVCGSCAQLDKTISEEQKKQISETLTGRVLSDEHRDKISEYMKNNEQGIERGKKNLIAGFSSGWNRGQETPQEVRDKISEANKGQIRTPEQRENISRGRVAWLQRVGGFTKEHREAISAATITQYSRGFDPKTHHRKGWHESPKAGRVFYRSSYERRAFERLDADDSVLSYEVEVVTVKYHHPIKDIQSSYLVDLLVRYTDGHALLLEIKPLKLVFDDINQEKGKAALKYAKVRRWDYRVWTEIDLFDNEKQMREYIATIPKPGDK
jgi:hypothetical protein